MTMVFAKVICPVCGLQARFFPAPDGRSTTEFDSAAFRGTCKTSGQSKTYECPDLNKAVETAGRTDFAPAE